MFDWVLNTPPATFTRKSVACLSSPLSVIFLIIRKLKIRAQLTRNSNYFLIFKMKPNAWSNRKNIFYMKETLSTLKSNQPFLGIG